MHNKKILMFLATQPYISAADAEHFTMMLTLKKNHERCDIWNLLLIYGLIWFQQNAQKVQTPNAAKKVI